MSLPATQSPEYLYEIYKNPTQYIDEPDVYAEFVHDLVLYNLTNALDADKFIPELAQRFKRHAFIQEIVSFIERKGSVRFGEINGWITEQCTDKPTPYRWNLKRSTNRLYNWLSYFYEEITWDIPGSHSQVIYWNDNN